MWINNELFKLTEIPKLYPNSSEYLEWWKEQKRRCIEGYWVGGKWMPGNLYFYINFGTILLNKRPTDKVKSKGKPLLWDIFWDLSYLWLEARGLTGFSEQREVMRLKEFYDAPYSEGYDLKEAEIRGDIPNIRDYLKNTTKNMGKPIFLNEAKDLMMMGNRGFGKSYFVADAIIAHEFLFDGLKEYTEESIKNPPSTEILVGAGDAKYSNDLLMKVKLCIDDLPGGVTIGDTFYPSPFFKRTSGSFAPGKELVALYKIKTGGSWHEKGTRSKLKHRTYKDNAFAGNGTRPAVTVKEEIGMFDNLRASQEADIETQMNGAYKFGSTMYLGTGGDMGGGTVDASMMFYDPVTYNMLAFEDIWEHKGSIAYFVPAYLGLHQFKDSEGNTNEAAAKKYLDEHREKLRRGKNAASALDAEVQNRPIVPSEMFLTKGGNIFPRVELQRWLGELEGNEKYQDAEYHGILDYDETGKVVWTPSSTTKPIVKFPVDPAKDDTDGAVVIWEHPFEDENGEIPHGLYVAGTDPYDHDESGTPSLGSTFIFKKFLYLDSWNYVIVAEYTGRPKADRYYEEARKLLMYYNARCNYENEKKGMHQYFDKKNATYLLMDQPGYIKDIVPNSKVDRVKGMHMSLPLKVHGETLVKNYLEEEFAPGRMNLTKIRSIPLLKELIAYNRSGNFDRVMALICTMYAVQETMRVSTSKPDEIILPQDQEFFSRNLFHGR